MRKIETRLAACCRKQLVGLGPAIRERGFWAQSYVASSGLIAMAHAIVASVLHEEARTVPQ